MATISTGSTIAISAYNDTQSIVNSVLGVGSGTTGYGQVVSSKQVTATDKVIYASSWTKLRNDLTKCYSHITNSPVLSGSAATYPNPPYLQIITSGSTIISSSIATQYANMAAYINANKATASTAQLTPNIVLTSTVRTASWGDVPDIISHAVTITFSGYIPSGGTAVSAADHARVFFNGGGSIQIRPTLVGYSGSKGIDWYNMFAGVGTINFRGQSVNVTGTQINSPGSVNSAGNFNSLVTGGSATTILTQASSASKYAENRYIVQVSRPTASTLLFTMIFQDNDAGDRTGLGAAVDESVTGTLTSAVLCTRPSTTNVDIPAPSGSATAL